jgi:hypothetical protein
MSSFVFQALRRVRPGTRRLHTRRRALTHRLLPTTNSNSSNSASASASVSRLVGRGVVPVFARTQLPVSSTIGVIIPSKIQCVDSLCRGLSTETSEKSNSSLDNVVEAKARDYAAELSRGELTEKEAFGFLRSHAGNTMTDAQLDTVLQSAKAALQPKPSLSDTPDTHTTTTDAGAGTDAGSTGTDTGIDPDDAAQRASTIDNHDLTRLELRALKREAVDCAYDIARGSLTWEEAVSRMNAKGGNRLTIDHTRSILAEHGVIEHKSFRWFQRKLNRVWRIGPIWISASVMLLLSIMLLIHLLWLNLPSSVMYKTFSLRNMLDLPGFILFGVSHQTTEHLLGCALPLLTIGNALACRIGGLVFLRRFFAFSIAGGFLELFARQGVPYLALASILDKNEPQHVYTLIRERSSVSLDTQSQSQLSARHFFLRDEDVEDIRMIAGHANLLAINHGVAVTGASAGTLGILTNAVRHLPWNIVLRSMIGVGIAAEIFFNVLKLQNDMSEIEYKFPTASVGSMSHIGGVAAGMPYCGVMLPLAAVSYYVWLKSILAEAYTEESIIRRALEAQTLAVLKNAAAQVSDSDSDSDADADSVSKSVAFTSPIALVRNTTESGMDVNEMERLWDQSSDNTRDS